MSSQEILFTASTTSLSHISNVLSSITPVASKCVVVINEKGLFFIVNEINICKAQLNLDSNFFDSFVFNKDLLAPNDTVDEDDDTIPRNITTRFGIDIQLLLESVTIANSYNAGFQQSTSAQLAAQQLQQQQQASKTNCILSYQGYGYPFVLSFEDEQMLERVEFQTFNIEQGEEEENESFFEIDNDRLILEMILKGPVFYDILRDLKEIQTEQIYIYCETKGDLPNLIFISKGELGYSKCIFPKRRNMLEEMVLHKMVKKSVTEKVGFSLPQEDVYDYVETNEDTITCFYNFTYFGKILKAAKLASKVKFKKDSNGLTSIIFLLKDETNGGLRRGAPTSTTVVEFKLLEFVSPDANDADDSTVLLNNNYNNVFIQNLIDDDDVTQLEFNNANFDTVQQHRIDAFYPPQAYVAPDTQAPASILDKLERFNPEVLANSTAMNNVQVNETLINKNGTESNGKSNRKRRKGNGTKRNDNDGIDVVGGAIEQPIFL